MILEDFYTPDILNEGFKISGVDKYEVPVEGPLSSYITFIREELPLNDDTSVFGLHENADITSAINDTNQLLGTALSLMPRKSAGVGKSQEDILNEKAIEILGKLPKNFDID